MGVRHMVAGRWERGSNPNHPFGAPYAVAYPGPGVSGFRGDWFHARGFPRWGVGVVENLNSDQNHSGVQNDFL